VNTDREDRRDVRAAYDAVARDYDAQFGRELDSRPLERGLLTAFIELAGRGVIADVGCGPGHVTRFLARQGADVIGIDLAPEMISVARERAPELPFVVGSMLDLPAEDGAWAGAVALYSIIHLTDDERARAFRELARVLQPNGRLLVSFHVDSPEFATGQVNHLTKFLGHAVNLDGHFLDPSRIEQQLEDADLATTARLERLPVPDTEYPSRRCYLIAQRG
jgi:ubiquinone/menaquinone biosynthesis C-methylase UbiE